MRPTSRAHSRMRQPSSASAAAAWWSRAAARQQPRPTVSQPATSVPSLSADADLIRPRVLAADRVGERPTQEVEDVRADEQRAADLEQSARGHVDLARLTGAGAQATWRAPGRASASSGGARATRRTLRAGRSRPRAVRRGAPRLRRGAHEPCRVAAGRRELPRARAAIPAGVSHATKLASELAFSARRWRS